MVAANILAVVLPINGLTTAEVADNYPSLFIPANFTFMIWPVIYFCLAAFTIYQQVLAFSGRPFEELSSFMRKMDHWFILSCIVNAGWLFAWHYEIISLSLILVVIQTSCLVMIHRNFGIRNRDASSSEKLFIELPFSIYLGWMAVALLGNVGSLLAYEDWAGSHPTQIRITILLTGIATAITMLMILYRNNIMYALVTVWALYGIISRRQAEGLPDEFSIIHACIMGIGLIAVTISWHLIRKQKSFA
ncbi:hypothetical protein [Chitinophaga sp. Cy-1792]|uniref:hypothetical protein n=1 Tax=Chitinophaga sp. Cy-1792 TaxID=2608339 RepID=UPI0014208534|nr:hypothetical protein [Chitinophaga sp. Cy-1792]NIG56089.1 hypothetical protein [Chitinophaga sp. Cy-1792]